MVVTEIHCVQSMHLWRESSSKINAELYDGYRAGNIEKKVHEILAGIVFEVILLWYLFIFHQAGPF